MKQVWVLETDDDDWYLGISGGEYECVILQEDAIQFARREDAERFLEFFNNLGLDTSDCFHVMSHWTD
jgi:hypothetical protein